MENRVNRQIFTMFVMFKFDKFRKPMIYYVCIIYYNFPYRNLMNLCSGLKWVLKVPSSFLTPISS